VRNIFPQTRLQQKLPESTERASALGNAFRYLPICLLLVVGTGLHMETEVQRTCT